VHFQKLNTCIFCHQRVYFSKLDVCTYKGHHMYFFTNMHVLPRAEVCTSYSLSMYSSYYIFCVPLDETFHFMFTIFSHVHGGFVFPETKPLLSRHRYVYYQSNNSYFTNYQETKENTIFTCDLISKFCKHQQKSTSWAGEREMQGSGLVTISKRVSWRLVLHLKMCMYCQWKWYVLLAKFIQSIQSFNIDIIGKLQFA
jgi:hypothetical protein